MATMDCSFHHVPGLAGYGGQSGPECRRVIALQAALTMSLPHCTFLNSVCVPCEHKRVPNVCHGRYPLPCPLHPKHPSVLSVCARLVFAASARRSFRLAISTMRYISCSSSHLVCTCRWQGWLNVVAGFAPQRVHICATSDCRRSAQTLCQILSVHPM